MLDLPNLRSDLNRTRRNQALPQGWRWTILEDICLPVSKVKPRDAPDQSFTYLDITSIDNSLFRVVSPKVYWGKDAPSRARQRVRTGNTLFSTVRTYLKNIALVSPEFDGDVASTGFCVLNTSEETDHRFVFYFVQADEFVSRLNPLQRGTSYPAVRDDDIRAQTIPLPPLAEQHRIVAEIETHFSRLDAAVAALKRAQANLKRYRAGVLKAACEGKLVPTQAELARAEGRDYEPAGRLLERILAERRARWQSQDNRRRKYKEPAAPDTSELPDLPEGWVWAKLPQLGELNRGKSKHRPRNEPRLLGGPYPFVQTGDIRQSRGLVTHHSQTYTDFGLLQSRLWPTGTLCITIAANIADTGILTYPACFPDSVVGFISDDDPVTTKFLEMFMRTVRAELERFAPSTAQKNINLKVLSDLAIPVPPLAEQHRIVADVERRLSLIQQAETAVDASLKRAGRLRQSILKLAFSGRLVPQDPNDEPASVLLERIRAQRAAAPAAAKRRQRRQRRRVPAPSPSGSEPMRGRKPTPSPSGSEPMRGRKPTPSPSGRGLG